MTAGDLYVPGEREDGGFALPVVDVDGMRAVPAFSSLEGLARYRPHGGGYVKLETRALPAIWPDGCGLLLDLRVTLTADQVASLADAPSLLIGEPREEPIEVLEAMRSFAAARPEVRAAYRALLVHGEPEPVVGLEVAPGAEARAVVEAAGVAARAAGIERLALLAIGDGGPVAEFLVRRTEPFYYEATWTSSIAPRSTR
jgi:hypothetical protein